MANSSSTDQLANLMSYTVLHIGVYTTLGAAVIAGGAIKGIGHWSLRVSLVCMLIAGACGGVIAASIPESNTWSDFKHRRLGPWGLGVATYGVWAFVEHTAFWVGTLVPSVVYLICGLDAFDGG